MTPAGFERSSSAKTERPGLSAVTASAASEKTGARLLPGTRPPMHYLRPLTPEEEELAEREAKEPPLGKVWDIWPFGPTPRFTDDPKASEPEYGKVSLPAPTAIGIDSSSTLGGYYKGRGE